MRLLLALALVLGMTGAPRADGSADLLPGLDGPGLSQQDLEQGSHLIVVWASWSPRCRGILERAVDLQRTWGSRARVATVVFQEEPARIVTFLDGQAPPVTTYLDVDGLFAKHQGVATLPALLVFRDGERRYRGALPIDPDPLIRRLLEQPPAPG